MSRASTSWPLSKARMAGTSPAMTMVRSVQVEIALAAGDQRPQRADQKLGGRAGWKEADIFALAAHQIDEGRVVDRVVGLGELDLGVIRAIGARRLVAR